MVKSVPSMVTKLREGVQYGVFKAWASAVHDWVVSHTGIMPENLGPSSVRFVARLTMASEFHAMVETSGALGTGAPEPGTTGDVTWAGLYEHLRDRL